jgi:hypothetical protein
MIASRTALDRARYLGEQIRDTCREELGLAGRRLVEWMLTILEALDPAPPAPGSHVHLLLDRYQREAHIFKRNMERSCEGERPGSRDDFEHDLPEKIRQIVQREIESVRQYLSSVGAGAQSAQLDAAIKGYGTAEFVTNLAGIRGVIAGAVLNAPRYGSIGATGSFDPEHPEEILRHMIEKSSEQLGVLSCMA